MFGFASFAEQTFASAPSVDAAVSLTGVVGTTFIGAYTVNIPITVVVSGLQATGSVGDVLVWSMIGTSQNASWQAIDESQSAGWQAVNENQSAGWQAVDESQSAGWQAVNDNSPVVWVEIPT